MGSITVRQAMHADLEALTPLFDAYRRFYGRSTDLAAARSFLRARFDHGESVVFIAHRDAQAVGFTQLYPSYSSVSLARVFILNDLFVDERARRTGAASGLLHAATEYARSMGAVRSSLNTDIANEAAQSLYQAAGWQRDTQFHAYHRTLEGGRT